MSFISVPVKGRAQCYISSAFYIGAEGRDIISYVDNWRGNTEIYGVFLKIILGEASAEPNLKFYIIYK